MTDYAEATDYEDTDPPESVREGLPGDLKDAKIKGGETYPAHASVRLNGPPGAGKSTQICLRVGTLIEQGVDPEKITIVTYRRSLADTITNRLEEWGVLSGDEDLQFWTTAHAAANRVTGMLQREKDDYKKNGGSGLGPAVTDFEKAYFCEEVLDIRWWPGQPWETTRGQLLFNVLEYAANNLLNPREEDDLHQIPAYSDLLEEWPGVNIAAVLDDWEEFKDRADLIEFHELLEEVRTGPLPPTEVVVVDEYHDAYPLLAQVAERWVSNAETAIIAGDPLQVVNSYAGADPRFFSERMDHLPEILLDKSWRVCEEHWYAATRMLEREFRAPPISRDGRGEIIEYRSPDFQYSKGAGWSVPGASRPGSPAAVFEEFVEDRPERDMLLLARTQKQAKGISAALDKAGVIHESQDDVGGWSEHQVDVLNAVLKLSDIPGNFGRDRKQYGLNRYNSDSVSVLFDITEVAAILQHTNARLLEITADARDELVNDLQDADDERWTTDDLDEYVSEDFWRRFTDGAATVRKLTKSDVFDGDDLKALQRAASRYDSPIDPDSIRKIRVLTIHASKGSEATDVVVYDGITGRISSEMERSQSTRENEARTWYVALTRSSERLHIMRGGFAWMKPHLPPNIRQAAAQRAERVADSDGGEPA